MMNRHTTFYLEDIKSVEFCGKTIWWNLTGGAYEVPFEISPTEGGHDFNKCPTCSKNLNELIKRLTEKFEGKNSNKKPFPFCCAGHSNLANVKEFKRESFINVPEMSARKIIYTMQHIVNNHNADDWYKLITDYIECAIESYGDMPKACGEPLYLSDYFLYVTDLVNKNKDLPADKKKRVLEF